MFKSRTRVLVILVCFSFLLLCSTLVFCSQTQNFGGNVDVFYTAPKGFLTYELNSAQDGWVVTGYDESRRNGETAIDIPDTYSQNGKTLPVTEIKTQAFKEATVFKSLTISQNILRVGDQAFYNCKGLVEINYNATRAYDVTRTSAIFYNAGISGSGIKVTIGNNVIRIPTYFFDADSTTYAPKITSLTIGDHVTEIGGCSFCYCSSLAGDLIIPDSVEIIGDNAFNACSITSVKISKNAIKIGHYAFYQCRKLKGPLTLPDTLSVIGSYAFYGCSSLTGSLTIPNGVWDIPEHAFDDCRFDGTLKFSNNLRSIGNSAFSGCYFTGTLTIPNSVTNIGEYPFVSNEFTSIKVDTANSYYTSRSNYGSESNVIIEKSTSKLIQGCSKSTIPSNVKIIGCCAFEFCGLTGSLTIPNGVTTIEEGAFYYCGAVTTVTISGSVTTIEDRAFYGCRMTNLIIEEGVTTIWGSDSFNMCENLQSVTIPSTLTEIRWAAFNSCKRLNELIINSSTIYKEVSDDFSDIGSLSYLIDYSGETIKILQSIDDGSNTYLKDTSIFKKSTTRINYVYYNVYTKL